MRKMDATNGLDDDEVERWSLNESGTLDNEEICKCKDKWP